jgi:hypothetical protein
MMLARFKVRVLFMKSDTRWPFIPWPSKIPKIQSPWIPAKFLTLIMLSWLIFLVFGMNPVLVLIAKFSTILF